MIPIAKPLIGEEEKSAVLEVLESGQLADGQKVRDFEQAFAEFVGVKHAIATSSGTTALHAALLAHGIGKGDEVITTPFSFIATANVISMVGATPIFVDIEEDTYNINPKLIEAAITKNTRAIMPVHLYGCPAEMGVILHLAQKYNLIVLEDACQAHGAEYLSNKVGSFGTGCFSFYPTKNMTTGEGGIITTNDDDVASKARKLIAHGTEEKYHHSEIGYNYRMTSIAAAIGIEQLKKLHSFNGQRIKNATFLSENISSQFSPPKITQGHVFHLYCVRLPASRRAEIQNDLTQNGIGTSIAYPVPIHKQEAYSHYRHLSFPIAERVSKEILALPVHPSLSQENLQKIVGVLNNIK